MSIRDSLNILWIGGVFDEATMLSSPAVSPAANRWQLGLLGGMAKLGCRIRALGHIPEPAWPRGRFGFLMRESDISLTDRGTISQRCVSYLNIPLLRDKSLVRSYVNMFRKLIRDGDLPDVIISYNIAPFALAVAYEAKTIGIPWVPLVADVSGDESSASLLQKALDLAAGSVFLSWSLFTKSEIRLKLHLDGGVTGLHFRIHEPESYLPSTPTKIFYSGSVLMEFGLESLIKAFSMLKDIDAKLIICGKGSPMALLEASRENPKIVLKGCLEDTPLTQLAKESSIMVNPRPNLPDHENNFPSKILEYISYGKPVISTWTPGLHPDFKSVLSVCVNDPFAMATTIRETIAWDQSYRLRHAEKCASFINNGRLWEQQAKRLMSWLESDILSASWASENVP